MGRIWYHRSGLVASLSETVGYKSGLALTEDEIIGLLADHSELLQGEATELISLRSELFAQFIAKLMFEVGNIPAPEPIPPGPMLRRRYEAETHKLELLPSVIKLFSEYLPDIRWVYEQTGEEVNLDSFMELVLREFDDPDAILVALDYIQALQNAAHIDPWSEIRRVEWVNTVDLAELFESESLDTYYGSFIDQRFIDYLDRQFESIDDINWRKFEALTAEYFEREGFYVEIGPGRNDEGVDIRVWPNHDSNEHPPTILVQCKRQRRKVGKVVVKALWADIQAEDAKSGLIVTTTALSPGAERVCKARSYPISEANGLTLREWIAAMRTPASGVFLAE